MHNYPPATTILTHIVYSTAYDEISNSPESITRTLTAYLPRQRSKSPTPHLTCQPYIFVYYQSGRHGPQNGWRLVSVEAGNEPRLVEERLHSLGPIEPDTRDFVVFGSNRDWVVVRDDEEPTTQKRVLEVLSCCSGIPLIQGVDIEEYIRRKGCYPMALKASHPISIAPATGRSLVFCLPIYRGNVKGTGGKEGKVMIVVKEGSSPEDVDRSWKDLVERDTMAVGDGDLLIFSDKGVLRYQAGSGQRFEVSPIWVLIHLLNTVSDSYEPGLVARSLSAHK
jgi:hypothetical protein